MDFTRSRELFREANDLVAGGVNSQVRRTELPVPLFFERTEGGYMWDVDGNKFIDYIMGRGPNLFGHAPRFVIDAVIRGMQPGIVFSGQHEQEIRVTKLVRKAVPLKGLVRYASSGTEIDLLALRVARGHTGRPKIVKFEGHYHGWGDTIQYSVKPPLDRAGPENDMTPVPSTGGMAPGSDQGLIIAPWNDVDALERIFERQGSRIAGVIMEPIMGNANCIMPGPGYLQGVKELCARHDALLIFDEVITGFRVALGGAQELFGVVPDVAVYAKAVAGGFPLAMLIGRTDAMRPIAEGAVDHGGTYNANTIAMSALEASLEHIMADADGFYRDLNAKGQRLMDGLRDASRRADSNLLVQGPGPFFITSFSDKREITNYREHARYCDNAKHVRFTTAMLERGVRISSGTARWHIASTHTNEDIEKTVAIAYDALRAL